MAARARFNIIDCKGSVRTVFARAFFKGYRMADLRHGEILLSVFFLPFTRQGEYVKEFKRARRRDDDIALVNADVHSTFFKLQLPSGPLIENSPGIKPGTLIACDRVCIPGLQRLQHLKKYAIFRRNIKIKSNED